MEAFAYPFRFRNSRAVTLDTETDAYRAQKIATAIHTMQGELEINPTFGSIDPVFGEFDSAGLLRTTANNFADISIQNITTTITDEGQPAIAVEFKSI